MQDTQQHTPGKSAWSRNYRPTKPEPEFTRHAVMRAAAKMDVITWDTWRKSLPPSPVPEAIRISVRGAMRTMEIRIATGNRVFSQFRSRIGLKPDQKLSESKIAKIIMEKLDESHKLLTGGIAESSKSGRLPSKRAFRAAGIIDNYAEMVAVDMFFKLLEDEKEAFGRIKYLLQGIPVYDQFLSKIKGIGPVVAGVLLAELNCYRAPHVSSFWRFLGVDPGPDGRGRGVYEEHMEEGWMKVRDQKRTGQYKMKRVKNRTYGGKRKSVVIFTGSEGILKACLRWHKASDEEYEQTAPQYRRIAEWKKDKPAEKKVKGASNRRKVKKADLPEVDPDLLCKQVVVAEQPYAKAYLDYKYRLSQEENLSPNGKRWKDCESNHRHNAAVRYMMKLFIADFWLAWRKLEGLPISEPYRVAVLGLPQHHEPSPFCHIGDNIGTQVRITVGEDEPEEEDDFYDPDDDPDLLED